MGGPEPNGTETEKPTQTVQHQSDFILPENSVNGYETDSNNQSSLRDGGAYSKNEGNVGFVPPHSLLPIPVPPEVFQRNKNDESPPRISVSSTMPDFGSFIRQRSSDLSTAIAKRVSSFRKSMEQSDENGENDRKNNDQNQEVTEFNLSGHKVVVKVKPEEEPAMKGRITLFSRSCCRDCTAVRRFFKEKELKFVEINVDVFREREKELRDRTGITSVPMIFFNEKLIGGLVALNSLRNSGEFDRRLTEMVVEKFAGDDAPLPPMYGCDYIEDDRTDEMSGLVSLLRRKLFVQDWLRRMKIIQNCFIGNEFVAVVIQHFKCARNEAVEIGKELSRKHFIHYVSGDSDFVDGTNLYRFLEHEPFIPRCFNFHGAVNDNEPKTAASVCDRLAKIMSAILESYASDDRRRVDYAAISKSEEFRRYVNMTQDLQRVNICELSENEKLAFFLNIYNAMVIHAIISVGSPEGVIDRRSFFNDFLYLIGGYPYSLAIIENGILRCNQRSPYSIMKPFSTGDKRLEVALAKLNPLFHFGLCNGTRSSPKVRFFSPNRVVDELRGAAREIFENGGIEVDLEKRTVYLPRIFKWFSTDFGQEQEILKWILNYVEPNKAGLLTHLLSDSGPVNISYQNFDWSLNS
ncbi:unnamed protein product [Lathyrus sativus]|nr:unnamed protein product [Lathyrus sativus]